MSTEKCLQNLNMLKWDPVNYHTTHKAITICIPMSCCYRYKLFALLTEHTVFLVKMTDHNQTSFNILRNHS